MTVEADIVTVYWVPSAACNKKAALEVIAPTAPERERSCCETFPAIAGTTDPPPPPPPPQAARALVNTSAGIDTRTRERDNIEGGSTFTVSERGDNI
jgi:hypothetical protein